MRSRPEPDEHTIPRPRWIVPVAIVGVVLLFLGLVIGRMVQQNEDDAPPPARTGGTPAQVVTTTAR